VVVDMDYSSITERFKRLIAPGVYKYHALPRAKSPGPVEDRGLWHEHKGKVLKFTMAAMSLVVLASLAISFA
jgi:hypothetical protein